MRHSPSLMVAVRMRLHHCADPEARKPVGMLRSLDNERVIQSVHVAVDAVAEATWIVNAVEEHHGAI